MKAFLRTYWLETLLTIPLIGMVALAIIYEPKVSLLVIITVIGIAWVLATALDRCDNALAREDCSAAIECPQCKGPHDLSQCPNWRIK